MFLKARREKSIRGSNNVKINPWSLHYSPILKESRFNCAIFDPTLKKIRTGEEKNLIVVSWKIDDLTKKKSQVM